MSEIDEGEVRALAHAFARTLGHLREFQDLRYVSAAAIPIRAAALSDMEGDDAADDLVARAALASEPPRLPEPEPSPPPASQPESPRAEPRSTEQSTYQQEQSPLSAPVNRDSAERRSAPAAAAKPRREGARDAGRDAGAERWPAAKKLSVLRERHVADCQGCRLAETRNSIVFGVGNPRPT
jgi:uracil-DNA glycosylase